MKKRLMGLILFCVMAISFIPVVSALSTTYQAVLEADAGTRGRYSGSVVRRGFYGGGYYEDSKRFACAGCIFTITGG